MGKLRFTVHPLFFVFGMYFAFSGKVFSFLTYTLVACIHECGHYIAANRCGYVLNRVVLMPYGAVIRGEEQNFSYTDEVIIALAGPFINVITAGTFVAVWWLFPESYPYTELAVTASVTIALLNMLPAYPLDGGRVLLALLSIRFKRKNALRAVKTIGIALSAAMIGLFVYSCFISPNLSILFFGSFMLFGNVFVSKDNSYRRAYSVYAMQGLRRGKTIKRVVVTEHTLVKDLFKFVNGGTLIDVEMLGKKKTVLSCDKTVRLLCEGNIYSTVFEEAERLFLLRIR